MLSKVTRAAVALALVAVGCELPMPLPTADGASPRSGVPRFREEPSPLGPWDAAVPAHGDWVRLGAALRSRSGAPIGFVQVAAGPSGVYAASVASLQRTFFSVEYQLELYRYERGAWRDLELLATDVLAESVFLQVGPKGPVVAYTTGRPMSPRVLAVHRFEGGAWRLLPELLLPPQWYAPQAFILDEAGEPIVAWAQWQTGVVIHRWSDATEQWEELPSPVMPRSGPNLSLASAGGRLYLACQTEPAYGKSVIEVRAFDDNGWEPLAVLDGAPEQSQSINWYPQLAVTGSGPWVSWLSNARTERGLGLHVARWGQGSLAPVVEGFRHCDGCDVMSNGRLLVGPNDELAAVWFTSERYDREGAITARLGKTRRWATLPPLAPTPMYGWSFELDAEGTPLVARPEPGGAAVYRLGGPPPEREAPN